MRPPLFEDPAIREWTAQFLRDRLPGARDGEVHFTLPSTGTKTPVAICALGDGSRVVVRLLKAWSIAARIANTQKKMLGWGLPVPRLLAFSGSGRLGPPRSWLTVEEFLDGQPFTTHKRHPEPDHMARLGRTLARLHGVNRRLAGRIGLPLPRPYVTRYLPRSLERVGKLRGLLGDRRAAELRRDLKARAAAIGARPRYELLHGHVNSGNFVMGADECWLIDFDAVRFGDFAQDLVRAVHRLTGDVPERQEALLASYFAHFAGEGAGPHVPTRAEYERLLPFYEADFQVSRAVGMRRKEQRGRHDEDHTKAMVERHVAEAARALAAG